MVTHTHERTTSRVTEKEWTDDAKVDQMTWAGYPSLSLVRKQTRASPTTERPTETEVVKIKCVKFEKINTDTIQ